MKPGGLGLCDLFGFADRKRGRGRRLSGGHADFALMPMPAVWTETLGAEGVPCPVSGPVLHLRPDRHGTDGFFVAVLERREADTLAKVETASDG